MPRREWPPYVPVAVRRRKAEKAAKAAAKKNKESLSPIVIEGRAIARTFWGQAWCRNLERYSDFSNRLPRGRTYARNGCIVDLKITPGEVSAMVSGSELYNVSVRIETLPRAQWTTLCKDCAGGIESVVELLKGQLSSKVMSLVCDPKAGLFPHPQEIEFSCSCPDWASMCKHIAAVLYGIGARLDEKPDLLFQLRKVKHEELIAAAGTNLTGSQKPKRSGRVIAETEIEDIFGIELAAPARKKPRSQRS